MHPVPGIISHQAETMLRFKNAVFMVSVDIHVFIIAQIVVS
jgi:uncharacterized membrane protein